MRLFPQTRMSRVYLQSKIAFFSYLCTHFFMSIILYINLQCPTLINEWVLYYFGERNSVIYNFCSISFLQFFFIFFGLSFLSMSIRGSLDACYFRALGFKSDNQTQRARRPSTVEIHLQIKQLINYARPLNDRTRSRQRFDDRKKTVATAVLRRANCFISHEEVEHLALWHRALSSILSRAAIRCGVLTISSTGTSTPGSSYFVTARQKATAPRRDTPGNICL